LPADPGEPPGARAPWRAQLPTSAVELSLRRWIRGAMSMIPLHPVPQIKLPPPTGPSNNGWHFPDDTQITDNRLVNLKKLSHLRSLYLKNTQVTDRGLEHLTALIELEHLSLDGTEVTDAGLLSLAGCTSLKTMSLENTHVTNTGVATLKRAMPGLDVRK
jgi:hypothetical protein